MPQTNKQHHFFSDFLLCGLCGWCMECFWTGLASIREKKDKMLMCHTSVFMFPIYGLAACFSPFVKFLQHYSVPIRGTIYAICIFICEFFTGTLLKKYNACPWDYSHSKFHYKGVIRFDYAPAWAIAGLIFERLLTKQSTNSLEVINQPSIR